MVYISLIKIESHHHALKAYVLNVQNQAVVRTHWQCRGETKSNKFVNVQVRKCEIHRKSLRRYLLNVIMHLASHISRLATKRRYCQKFYDKHISAHRADATLLANNVGCKKCRVGSVSRNKIEAIHNRRYHVYL